MIMVCISITYKFYPYLYAVVDFSLKCVFVYFFNDFLLILALFVSSLPLSQKDSPTQIVLKIFGTTASFSPFFKPQSVPFPMINGSFGHSSHATVVEIFKKTINFI